MRIYLLFFLFLSYPLFAQDSTGTATLSQGEGSGEVPLNKVTAAFLLQQLQKETVLLKESIDDISLFGPSIIRANHGLGKWVDPFSPGKMFNRCASLLMSIRCYWSLLRFDRLANKGRNENTEIINGWTSLEHFKEEVRRVKSFEAGGITSIIWLFLFALEFYDWAVAKEVSDPGRLFPLTDTLAGEYLNNHEVLFNQADSPVLLYALHRYFLKRGFDERRRQIETYIKALYLNRNAGNEEDLRGKALTCDAAKRAGVHKDYLKENGLLFPDYGDFEERTAAEDVKRVQDCEEQYEKGLQLHEYDRESDITKHEGLLMHYGAAVFVLYKVFGKEAVRDFFRQNPLLYKIEVIPFIGQRVLVWGRIYQVRVTMALILRDIYEDDVEWQMEWQSIIDGYNKELSRNLLSIYSDELLVSVSHILHFMNLSLLEQE